jgi:recombination protein RecR
VHLLRVPEGDALQLATAIEEARARIQPCPECYGFAEDGLCPICRDTRRDDAMICVVEAPQDVDPIERSGAFRGRYHVLGGALSPLDGVDPEDLTIAQLVARVDRGGITEVIVATNPTMTGEATAAYIAGLLRDRTRITRLASGLPVGGDLEFADEVTLGRALEGRRSIDA